MTRRNKLRLDQWLTLAAVEAALPALRHFDVSKVARGDKQSTVTGDGFLPNYRKAKGDPEEMEEMAATPSESWATRRNNFVKRHMGQALKNKEKLFVDGVPSGRLLGLIAWAYVPPTEKEAVEAWYAAGCPVEAQNRRNGAFLPPTGKIPFPRYDTGYGPWHPGVDLVPEIVLVRLGAGRKSSLDSPVDFDLTVFPEGTWVIDSFSGLYGRGISELVWVNTDDVIPSELDEKGRLFSDRRHYVDPYIQWIQAGHQPPPVHIIEMEDGSLRLTDGHRRYVVAKTLGLPLLALVSYTVPTGELDSRGRPLKTELTLEIARQDADLIGRMDGEMSRKLRAWEDENKPELAQRRRLLSGTARRNTAKPAPPPSAWDAPDREASTVQSIIFDRTVWTAREAKRWLREHDYKAPNVDRQPNVYRFRQHAPFLFHKDSFRTIPFGAGTGIQAIVAIPK